MERCDPPNPPPSPHPTLEKGAPPHPPPPTPPPPLRALPRPHRHLPEGVAARVADGGDHFAPALIELFARHSAVLGDGVGIAVAPGLPDAGEDLAVDAQGVDDDVVGGDVGDAEVVEEGERLAADVQVAAG